MEHKRERHHARHGMGELCGDLRVGLGGDSHPVRHDAFYSLEQTPLVDADQRSLVFALAALLVFLAAYQRGRLPRILTQKEHHP